MHNSETKLSRRSMISVTAAAGVGVLVDYARAATIPNGSGAPLGALTISNDEWFAQRAWSVSGNKVLGATTAVTSLASRIYRPQSAGEIAAIVKSLPATTPIACVCGGHESSNAALVASGEAVIIDLILFKSIKFHRSSPPHGPGRGKEGTTPSFEHQPGGKIHGSGDSFVTVGSGVVFRELVEAVKQQGGALPVGTGPGVGVAGYVTNGGLSGYFSRRLGLLGQRVVKMTVVTAAGDIRTLTPKDELFTAMLGAGSALAIVVDLTIRMADASVVNGAAQRVFGFETREQAVGYSREAMQFMREHVIPNESVSLEIVVTGTKAIVATTLFYDTFDGDTAAFVKPLDDLAASRKLPTLAQAHWSSWYEAAAALWPVIAELKGNPLAALYHCMGTEESPGGEVINFVSDTVVGQAPLDQAQLSIIEIRSLGGAVQKGPSVPTGNCHHAFFVDLITTYDARSKTPAERQKIAELTNQVIDNARQVDGLGVDFSGTHSQPDDVGRTTVASEIFGSETMAISVQTLKKKMDPNNRFRFHPFAKFLA